MDIPPNRPRPFALRHALVGVLALAVMGGVSSAVASDDPNIVPEYLPLRAADMSSTFALRAERLELRRKIADRLIPAALDALTSIAVSPADRRSTTVIGPISDAVWGTGLVNYQGADFRDGVTRALDHFGDLAFRTQRDLLEAVHTLYGPLEPEDPLVDRLRTRVLAPGAHPRMAAMAAVILRRHPETARTADVDTVAGLTRVLSRAIGADAAASTSPHVQAVLRSAGLAPLPPWPATSGTLLSLLRHPAPVPDLPLLVSIQGTRRDYPGLIVARRRDGRFVRDHEGTIVQIRLLARAQTNLPGTFSNGNTPAGYMSIQGLARSASGNVFIGPAPMIVTELPVEAGVDRWFHGRPPATARPADPTTTALSWTPELYAGLLPDGPELAVFGMKERLLEAWTAGQAGRSEIILHGNVTEPGLHAVPGPRTRAEILTAKGNPWSPFGPSMGCATPIELWDEETGQCLRSDQIRLVHLLLAADANRDLPPADDPWPQHRNLPQPRGFLLTVDLIPPREEGFLEVDLEPILIEAEKAAEE
jgi:hypothetical protein